VTDGQTDRIAIATALDNYKLGVISQERLKTEVELLLTANKKSS